MAIDTTVVVPVRNLERHPTEQFWSSLSLQREAEFYTVVVDYGSSIDALAWERELFNGDGVFFLETGFNDREWRESHARNIGVKMSTTPFVVSIVADIILSENTIAVVQDELRRDPNILVMCLRVDTDDKGQEIGYAPNCNYGTLMGFEKEWFSAIGGFDEYYAEWGRLDMDLAFRAKSIGKRWAWAENKTKIIHQYHPFHISGLTRRNDEYFYSRDPNDAVRNVGRWGELI